MKHLQTQLTFISPKYSLSLETLPSTLYMEHNMCFL